MIARLLDRERELRELGDALSDARRECGRIVVIEGPAGIGKTTLLAALFDDAAERGFAAFRARASDLESNLPYGCLHRLLEPAVSGASACEPDPFEDAAALASLLFTRGDPAKGGLEQLTASERRVAELAAKGNSNPQIAQTLFVSRKTVETHLGRIYSKLEIAGRAELARALGRQAED
jgi:ATP/maltotriose-dependent transcriptional regulator MalT